MAFKFEISDIAFMKYLGKLIIGIALIVIAVAGCRKTGTITEPVEPVVIDTVGLEKYQSYTFSINQVNIRVDKRARLKGWLTDNSAGFSFAGIWIAVKREGEERANLVDAYGSDMNSNYTMKWGDDYLGIYSITQEEKENYYDNWPIDNGAPYYINSPKLYGEEMCWASFRPDTAASVPIYSKSVKGLRINFSIYGYSSIDLSKLVFLNFKLANIGYQNIEGMYAGFYLNPYIHSDGVSGELTGYDSVRSMTYVYSNAIGGDRLLYDVIGYTFLETPSNVNDQPVISSNRRMIRGHDSDFGNYFISVEQVLNALKGLSNRGRSMKNPVSGEPTKFAYTGNPVTGEGWVDYQRDVRTLTSTGPFNIPVGESRNFIVCLIFEEGNNLETAFGKLKTKVDQLRKMPSLWKY